MGCDNYKYSLDDLIELVRGKNGYQIEEILISKGVKLPDKFGEKIFDYVKAYKVDYSTKMPNVDKMLELLEKYPKVVCSNALAEYYPIDLEGKGLAKHFKGFFGIDNTGCSKPDHGIYTAGAKYLNIDIKNCLILEDSPSSGVKAGIASGSLYVVGFTGSGTPKEEFIEAGVHYVIDSLLELPRLIEEINK